VHLNTKQYASSYHYFSVAINLKPDFPNSYMYLGITLNRLNDFQSAQKAFNKAIELEKNDCTIHFNHAVVLFNNGKIE
jgi:Bardet-Biedl syndrome 4 protein